MNKYFVYILILLSISNYIPAQSMQELQKMKSEYEKMQKDASFTKGTDPLVEKIDPLTGLPEAQTINPYYYVSADSSILESRHFGYNFFTKRDSIPFWQNLPAPDNYLLGPGDELVISVWGATQLRETYTISREGTIYDEKVGLLYLTGKNLDLGSKYLVEQFSRVYSTLKEPKPSSYMDVSLGKLQSINVNFVGEVLYPGVHTLHPYSNLILALIESGGIDTTGTLRNIVIKRNGQSPSSIDLYNYLLKGDLPENIQLRDQDIIYVPVRLSSIEIDSAVTRPGIYEAIEGETVKDLIEYAGGTKVNASNTIGIKRILPKNERSNLKKNISTKYFNYNYSDKHKVQDGDFIKVLRIFDELTEVEVIGQVKMPGPYFFYEGMTLRDLILLSGGFEDTSYLNSIYLKNAQLIRRNPNIGYETIIDINLNQNIKDETSFNIKLHNLDKFVVHANKNFFERKNIKVYGEVLVPGSYPLLKDDENLLSIIKRAGGLTSKALENGISIFRSKEYFENPPKDTELNTKILNKNTTTEYIENKPQELNNGKIKLGWQGMTVKLMPGDSIIIKPKVGAVYIYGEVYNSGLVEFEKGKSVKYYIDSVGGINNYGDRSNVIIVYPNGITVPWNFFSPKIIDGSTIIVYKKADLTPFNITLFANNISSILTSLVTIFLLSQQLNP